MDDNKDKAVRIQNIGGGSFRLQDELDIKTIKDKLAEYFGGLPDDDAIAGVEYLIAEIKSVRANVFRELLNEIDGSVYIVCWGYIKQKLEFEARPTIKDDEAQP